VLHVQVCVCVCVCVCERVNGTHWQTIYIRHEQQQRFETRLVNINIIDVSSIACRKYGSIHVRVSCWKCDIHHQCRTAQYLVSIIIMVHRHSTAKSIKAKQNSNVFILGQVAVNNSTFEGRNVEWRSSYNSQNESMEITNSSRSSFCKA
jgi:hypothetical protein